MKAKVKAVIAAIGNVGEQVLGTLQCHDTVVVDNTLETVQFQVPADWANIKPGAIISIAIYLEGEK